MGRRFPNAFAAPGEHEGEDAIRMLARHPKTAQRVTLRLAQFFVADQPSQALLNSLHRTFLDTGGDMRQVMQTLLGSADFWAPENRLFKTPMDFACSALAEGGKIDMPLADMFWGAYFGSLVDQFGIHWMFNCANKD